MNYRPFFLAFISLVGIISCEREQSSINESPIQNTVDQPKALELQYTSVTDPDVLKDINALGFNINDFPVTEILNKKEFDNGYIVEGDMFITKKQIASKRVNFSETTTVENANLSKKRVGVFGGRLAVANCDSARDIKIKLDFEFSSRLQRRINNLQSLAQERGLTRNEEQLLSDTESRLSAGRLVRSQIRRVINRINRIENSFLNFELVRRNATADINIQLSDGIVIGGSDLSQFAAITSLPNDDGNINSLFIINIPMVENASSERVLNLIMHELLHTVGMSHTDQIANSIAIAGTPRRPNPRSIMNSFVSSNLRLTRADRIAISELFGTDNPDNLCETPGRTVTETNPI